MTYPSNSGESVAHTQIKAFVERVERLDEELKAINDDKKEIFAEARGNGFDIAALKQVIKLRRQDANERMEREAIVELYMSALGMVPAREYEPAPVHVHMRVENIEEFGSDEAKTEPHPTKADGSDLAASPANDDGQVADNPVAKAADDANSGDATSEVSAVADAPEQADVASRVAGDRAPAATSEDMDATAGETAPKPMYAEPGVVTWESCPPEPVERHEYSAAFGDLGQDIEVITEDMQEARSAPIVKVKNKILDGWARYMKARELGIEYPVVQYDGTDWLVDCIKWNVAGRILTNQHKQIIAARLIKIYPQRKGIILAVLAGEDIGV